MIIIITNISIIIFIVIRGDDLLSLATSACCGAWPGVTGGPEEW